MSGEELNKRFGVIAIEKGFITDDQLYEAIEIQIREELESFRRRYISHILFELDYITKNQVDEILEFMGLL